MISFSSSSPSAAQIEEFRKAFFDFVSRPIERTPTADEIWASITIKEEDFMVPVIGLEEIAVGTKFKPAHGGARYLYGNSEVIYLGSEMREFLGQGLRPHAKFTFTEGVFHKRKDGSPQADTMEVDSFKAMFTFT